MKILGKWRGRMLGVILIRGLVCNECNVYKNSVRTNWPLGKLDPTSGQKLEQNAKISLKAERLKRHLLYY